MNQTDQSPESYGSSSRILARDQTAAKNVSLMNSHEKYEYPQLARALNAGRTADSFIMAASSVWPLPLVSGMFHHNTPSATAAMAAETANATEYPK
jgi:hypothetical protein